MADPMRIRAAEKDGIVDVKVLMKHDMESGQRKDAAGIPLSIWLAILDQDILGADLQRTLPRLKAPTLLIWGEKDPIIEVEGRQTLRAALPAAQTKVFAGLGHNPFWENPAAVADVVNTFLLSQR